MDQWLGKVVEIPNRARRLPTALCLVMLVFLTFGDLSAQPSSLLPEDNIPPGDLLAWLAGPPFGMQLGTSYGIGPVIEAVQSGGAAEQGGLRPGDTLVLVDRALADPHPATVAQQLRAAWKAGKSAVDVVVSRRGHDFYAALPIRR